MLLVRLLIPIILLLTPVRVEGETQTPKVEAAIASIEKAEIPPIDIPPVAAPIYTATKQQVIELIKKYSALYKVSPSLTLAIARCESGYNHTIKNSHSSASGTFQFINATWVSTRKQMGLDPSLSLKLNAEEGVKTGVWKIANGGIRAWDASKSCWSQ